MQTRPAAPPDEPDPRPTIPCKPWNRQQLWLVLLMVVAAGLLVRGLHFGAISGTAFIDFPLAATQTDMWGFWTWSGEILAGDVWGRDPWHPDFLWMRDWGTPEDWAAWWGGLLTFQQEPFYPYLLAALRSVGAGLSSIIWLQLTASALAALPVFFLTRHYASDLGAVVAAVLVVLYGPLVFYAGTLLRDWFSALIEPGLVLLTLVASRSRRPGLASFALGSAMGAALLVKSTALVLVAGLIAWSLVAARPAAKAVLVRGTLLTAGLVAGLSPLIARNLVVGAPPFQISNRFVESFVMANVADASPVGFQYSPKQAVEVLRKAEGRMGPALVETLSTFDGDVGLFLAHQWVRFRALVDPVEIPNNLSYAYGQRLSPVLRVMPGWGVVLPVGLAGLVVCVLAAPRRHSLLLVYLGGLAVPALVMFAIDRYRLGLAVFMCIMAGILVGELHQQWRRGRWRPAAWAAGIAFAASALQNHVLALPDLRTGFNVVVAPAGYATSADIYRARGDLNRAMNEARALRGLADDHPHHRERIEFVAKRIEYAVLLQGASAAFAAGRAADAQPMLDAALSLADEVIDDPVAQVYIALVQEQAGLKDAARERAARYLEQQPDGSAAPLARALLERLD